MEAKTVSCSSAVCVTSKEYPQLGLARAPELHQVLYKAAALQVAHPDLGIVPVLMCVGARTFRPSGWLDSSGFQVIQARAQFLPDSIEPELLP